MADFLGADQAPDRLEPGYSGGDEDGEDDEVTGVALGGLRSHQEGRAERDRGSGIAEVVDQVGEQGDAAGRGEDRHLHQRGEAEHDEREHNRANACLRAFDRGVDQAVGVTMIAVVVSLVFVAVRAAVGMGIRQLTVAV